MKRYFNKKISAHKSYTKKHNGTYKSQMVANIPHYAISQTIWVRETWRTAIEAIHIATPYYRLVAFAVENFSQCLS